MKIICFCTLCFVFVFGAYAQSFDKKTVAVTASIGSPHLFKGILKLAVNSEGFKGHFGKAIEVSPISGLNPISFKGEYGINKYFGLGVSVALWSIKFNVSDYYNLQNQNAGTFIKDSVDTYSFKISSQSLGVRPNFHFPIKNPKHDVYMGLGLGITKNKLTIGFNSTDAGRFIKSFGKDLEYDLSLPGGVYFSPSIGYRTYFGKYVGLNFEFGYEKGAIIQGGLAVRLNHQPKEEKGK